MKKLLGILVLGLLFCSIGYAKTKITEVKRSVKEDGEGILKLKENEKTFRDFGSGFAFLQYWLC